MTEMKLKFKKKVFFILLAVMATAIAIFIASVVWDMALILNGNIKITT